MIMPRDNTFNPEEEIIIVSRRKIDFVDVGIRCHLHSNMPHSSMNGEKYI